jgi:ATP-dependent Zn protease
MKKFTSKTIAIAFPLRTIAFLRLLSLISLILIVVFVIFYIFQVSQQIQEKSLILNFEEKKKELYNENGSLELAFSQKNYLKNVEKSFEELGFEKIAKVDYIKVLDTSFAVKQ